ncbi:hypothetical protein CsSME_00007002 [Camellia sinensis var. sinensis]
MEELGFYIDETTYLTILGVLRNSKMATDATAWTQLYNRMAKENDLNGVVKKVVQVVTQSDWCGEVERELGEMKISVSDDLLLTVLKDLRGYPLKTLRFFKWVSECLGFEHNSVTYNAIARVLGQGDSIAEFWSTVREMKGLGHEMDIDTYIKISRQFQKNKMVEDAVDFLKALTVKEHPSVSAYLHVFKAFFQEGRHSEAKDLLYKCPHHIRKHVAICSLFGSAKSSSAATAA